MLSGGHVAVPAVVPPCGAAPPAPPSWANSGCSSCCSVGGLRGAATGEPVAEGLAAAGGLRGAAGPGGRACGAGRGAATATATDAGAGLGAGAGLATGEPAGAPAGGADGGAEGAGTPAGGQPQWPHDCWQLSSIHVSLHLPQTACSGAVEDTGAGVWPVG